MAGMLTRYESREGIRPSNKRRKLWNMLSDNLGIHLGVSDKVMIRDELGFDPETMLDDSALGSVTDLLRRRGYLNTELDRLKSFLDNLAEAGASERDLPRLEALSIENFVDVLKGNECWYVEGAPVVRRDMEIALGPKGINFVEGAYQYWGEFRSRLSSGRAVAFEEKYADLYRESSGQEQIDYRHRNLITVADRLKGLKTSVGEISTKFIDGDKVYFDKVPARVKRLVRDGVVPFDKSAKTEAN